MGASGSGKSTLARCLTQFETPTGGEILFEGSPLSPHRRLDIQLIFQQPAASLNPRFTAAEIVEEPLVIQRAGTGAGRRERAAFALELTGIARTALGKRAHEFSGGERQRLAIARALVAEPKVLILDESFNGLDVTLAAQIAALLTDLQQRLGVAYILISHDLTLVAGLADEIAVMDRGTIVEHAPTATLMSQPRHARDARTDCRLGGARRAAGMREAGEQMTGAREACPTRYDRMAAEYAARLVHSLVLLAGVSVLSFLFADLAPGDFFTEMRLDPLVPAGTAEALRVRHGLDRPLPVRYAAWLGSMARGEFGYSLAYNSAVGPLLRQRIPGTLLLTATATLLAWLMAIPLGIWNAANRGTWKDSILKVALSILLSIPDLLLAVILLVLAVETSWLPAGGMHAPGAESWSTADRIRDTLRHMVIPVAVLVLGMLPTLVRHVRSAVADAMDSPFALAARAHGIPRRPPVCFAIFCPPPSIRWSACSASRWALC